MKEYSIGVVGATGLVGRTILKLLEEYQINVGNLKLFASDKSKGKRIKIFGKYYYVETLCEGCFKELDFVLFSAGAKISKIWAPKVVKEGGYVIDNSSCFRMKRNCALIVPEINLNDYKTKSKIIANPNCSTIQCVVIVKTLDDLFNVKRINYTTYQSVSGSGQKGIIELKRCINHKDHYFYPYDISKTVIPEIDEFLINGYTKEEMKMVDETRKILHKKNLKISATCVRVPIESCHGVVVRCELVNEYSDQVFKEKLKTLENVIVLDDPTKHIYPTSIIAKGNDNIYVGRIRKDLSCKNGVLLFVTSDNIRKGAASNAVQILKGIINNIN